jgi:hypothetical protein
MAASQRIITTGSRGSSVATCSTAAAMLGGPIDRQVHCESSAAEPPLTRLLNRDLSR